MLQRFRDLGFVFCGSAIAYGFCGEWLEVGVFAAGSILFFALYIREEMKE